MSISKQSIRPTIISSTPLRDDNIEEKFQNEVLRPIIKLQNSLILLCFDHFLSKLKIEIQSFKEDKRTECICKLFKTNIELTTELRGLTVGQFTTEEYHYYLENKKKLNKRIHFIISKRVQSHYS